MKTMKKQIKSVMIVTTLVLTVLLTILPSVLAAGENTIGLYTTSSQVTVGDKFLTNINVTVVWQIDTASILNMTFTPGVLNYSNISCGNLFSAAYNPTDLLIWYHPQDDNGWSVVDNATGYAKQITAIDNDVVNNTNKSLALLYWDASEVGIGHINLTDYHCYNDTTDYGTLSQNITIYVYPDYPSSFSTSSGTSWDNLTWSRGSGEDNAMVRYSTSTYPTTISEGTLLYNGSIEYNNFSKDIDKDYYYSIWGWNETFGWHSLSYDTETSSSLAGLPSGFNATTDNRTAISLNWTTEYTSTLTLRPSANGASSQWTPTAGSNYENVDDISPDGDTTRVRSDGVGHRDSYNITNHTVESSAITQVKVYSRLYDDGNTGMTCRITIYDYTQGSYKNNTAFSPTGSYADYSYTWTENPWTSSAWTWSDIDNLEIGNEYVSSSVERIYCTQMYAEVTYSDSPTNVVERNIATPWARGSGTEVHNSTDVSFTDTGLWPNTLYYYQLWTYDGDTNFSSANVSTFNTTDSNSVLAFSSEDPSDNDGNISIDYATVSVTIQDPEGNTFNWTIEGEHITNAGQNEQSNGSKSANVITSLPFNTNIIWYVNSTDIYSWTNATYNFTSREQYSPSVPTGFTATAYNRTRIDLSWTKTDDRTYVEFNSFAGWERGLGTILDNGTNASFSHTSLSEGTAYYYQIWSFNTTDSVFSSANASANDVTVSNQIVVLAGETPADDTNNVAVTQSSVNVTIVDSEGDTISWTIETSTGDSDSGNDTNASVSCSLTTPHDYEENVIWYINTSDSFDWTNATYNFTVRSQYIPSAPPTAFTATNISSTQINLAWSNNGNNYTVVENNSAEGWALGSGNEIYNGSSESYSHTGLSKDTTYYYQAWSYNVTDNAFSVTNTTVNNVTQANTIPNQLGGVDVYPANATEWIEPGEFRANVTDPDGDVMDVSFYWQNGTLIGTNSSVATGTTANITIPFVLTNYTWFYWYVNVTDGEDTYHSQDWVFRQEAYDHDVDRDSKCFPSDLSGVAAHYMESDTPHWIRADVNRGGSIGPEDLSGIAAHYMEEY